MKQPVLPSVPNRIAAGPCRDERCPVITSDEGHPANFGFDNVNRRPPSRFLRVLRILLTGVDKVENQIAPYAAGWHEKNLTALAGSEPLWIALGDSISQGIGATSIEQGWIPQAQRLLAAQGLRYRVVNLSISGATTQDVLEREIPAINDIFTTPAVVTLFIGSNDVLHHSRREALPGNYRAILAALPATTFVAVVHQSRGPLVEVTQIVNDADRRGTAVAVPRALRGQQSRRRPLPPQ